MRIGVEEFKFCSGRVLGTLIKQRGRQHEL